MSRNLKIAISLAADSVWWSCYLLGWLVGCVAFKEEEKKSQAGENKGNKFHWEEGQTEGKELATSSHGRQEVTETPFFPSSKKVEFFYLKTPKNPRDENLNNHKKLLRSASTSYFINNSSNGIGSGSFTVVIMFCFFQPETKPMLTKVLLRNSKAKNDN